MNNYSFFKKDRCRSNHLIHFLRRSILANQCKERGEKGTIPIHKQHHTLIYEINIDYTFYLISHFSWDVDVRVSGNRWNVWIMYHYLIEQRSNHSFEIKGQYLLIHLSSLLVLIRDCCQKILTFGGMNKSKPVTSDILVLTLMFLDCIMNFSLLVNKIWIVISELGYFFH